jgi:hypothetical protein
MNVNDVERWDFTRFTYFILIAKICDCSLKIFLHHNTVGKE